MFAGDVWEIAMVVISLLVRLGMRGPSSVIENPPQSAFFKGGGFLCWFFLLSYLQAACQLVCAKTTFLVSMLSIQMYIQ